MLVHEHGLYNFEVPGCAKRNGVAVVRSLGAGFLLSSVINVHGARQTNSQGAVFIEGTQSVVVVVLVPFVGAVLITEGTHGGNRETVNRSNREHECVGVGGVARSKSTHASHAERGFEGIKTTHEIKVAAGAVQSTDVTGCNRHDVVRNLQVGLAAEEVAVQGTRIRLVAVFEGKAHLPAVAEFFFTGQTPNGVAVPCVFHGGRRGAVLINSTGRGELIGARDNNARGDRAVQRNARGLHRGHRESGSRCCQSHLKSGLHNEKNYSVIDRGENSNLGNRQAKFFSSC